MTQKQMTLTFNQGHSYSRSMPNLLKMDKKNHTIGHISDHISPTDFILGTKVQPIKAHSMTQVSMSKFKVKCQGQNLPKMGKE